MNTSLKLLAAAMLAASLAGCASTGNEKISETAVAPGASQQQVREALGEPDIKSFGAEGNEVWEYMHMYAAAKPSTFVPIIGPFIGGTSITRKQLVIQFTPDGKAARVLWNAGPSDVNYGR